jgi:hypothetical protein
MNYKKREKKFQGGRKTMYYYNCTLYYQHQPKAPASRLGFGFSAWQAGPKPL